MRMCLNLLDKFKETINKKERREKESPFVDEKNTCVRASVF